MSSKNTAIKTINLNEFRREDNKRRDKTTRSVLIYREHQDFLDSRNLNLSKLVREYLDRLMRENKKE